MDLEELEEVLTQLARQMGSTSLASLHSTIQAGILLVSFPRKSSEFLSNKKVKCLLLLLEKTETLPKNTSQFLGMS